jgi:hypothetical protein
LAVAHRDADGNAVIDALRERRPPFSPAAVVDEFCALLKSYRVSSVHGDRYAGGFASEAFNRHGIRYQPAARTKSDAYVDLLPLLNSGPGRSSEERPASSAARRTRASHRARHRPRHRRPFARRSR